VPFPGTAFAAELHDHTTVAAVSGVAANQLRSAKTSHTPAVLRDLWVGHIFWVRNVSIAIFNTNDAAMKVAEGQAVSNAKSIAATIEPFYGVATGKTVYQRVLMSCLRTGNGREPCVGATNPKPKKRFAPARVYR
jgi:hypothetical protein